MAEIFLHDPLTGLYHRNYFFFRLNEEISRAKRKGVPLCLVFIDMDFFKMVNDNFGHQVGDEVLKQFAENIRNFLRESDLIFRYGGDEFVIILPDVPLDDAVRIAQRVKEQVESQGYGPTKNLKLSISMGISQFPIDGLTSEELLKAADERALNSKKMGRGKIVTKSEPKEEEEVLNISLSNLRIIGREAEIHAFTKLLNDFRNSNRRFIAIIRGMKGIGITRIIEEIGKISKLMDIEFIKVAIEEKDLLSPFPLIKALLREILTPEVVKELDENQKRVVSAIFPELIHDEVTLTISELKLLSITLEILNKLEPKHTVIAIDNGHLMTQKCTKTLVNILKDESTRNISLIISKRSKNFLEEALKGVYGELHFFDITPLKREEVKTILWQLLRVDPPDEFIDWVMIKTGGRPFYINKLLNALLISRKIIPYEDQFLITDSYYVDTENFLLPLIEELAGLTPQEREVIDYCALYNMDFTTSIISAITDYPPNHLLEIFENLTKNGYIEEVIPYNLYRFTNPFIREIIISQISKEKRISMHYKIVRALEENPEETYRLSPNVLYEHYIESGMENKAIPYLELLVKNEIKKRNFKKAIIHIQRIFNVAEHRLTISEKISLLRNWALCLRYEGEYHESMQKLNQALELAKKYSEKYQEALIRLDIAWIQHEKQYQTELLLNVQEIEKLANEMGDKDILSNALIFKALYYLDFQKNLTKAALILEEILELQKEEENHEILAKAYANLGKCYRQLRKYNKALSYLESAIYHARLTDKPDYLAAIMHNYATLQYAIQDMESARITHEKALEIIRRENLKHLLHHSYYNLAMIYVNYGEYTLAINYLERAIDNCEELGLKKDSLAFKAIFHGVKAYLGDYRYHAEKLEEIMDISQKENYPFAFERAASYLIPVYTMLGDITSLKRIAKHISMSKDPRTKKIAIASISEALVIFSQNPEDYTEILSQLLNESVALQDLLSELAISTSLYVLSLLSKNQVKIDLETILQRAKSSHLLKQYFDILLIELIFGKFHQKQLVELKNNESRLNLKQKLLLKLAEARALLISDEFEKAEQTINETAELIHQSENKYCEVMMYRMLAEELKTKKPDVSQIYLNQVSNLLYSDLKELVLS
jgi:diguanylate cyclase (GGDEF)-like protein